MGVRGAGGPGGGHLIPGGPSVERARGGRAALIGPILKGEGRTLKKLSTTGSSMPANDAHSLGNESELPGGWVANIAHTWFKMGTSPPSQFSALQTC